jgi:hypothetical protein
MNAPGTFLSDVTEIRRRARQHLADGAVTNFALEIRTLSVSPSGQRKCARAVAQAFPSLPSIRMRTTVSSRMAASTSPISS